MKKSPQSSHLNLRFRVMSRFFLTLTPVQAFMGLVLDLTSLLLLVLADT